MKYEGDMCGQSCTEQCDKLAVVGDGDGRALCFTHLHLLPESGWEQVKICWPTSGTLRYAVLAYIREQFPDYEKVTAPISVGCNTICYDTEGVLADGHRVTLAQLEAMVARVKELQEEGREREASGKQRVWWGVFASKENTYYPRNYRDTSCGLHQTLAACKRNCADYWEPRPCDADGNEVEVRWRLWYPAQSRWTTWSETKATKKEADAVIQYFGWRPYDVEPLPVLASNPNIELDLCLGGATWEPAA